MTRDEEWMQKALELARDAAKIGEVPVGAIVVFEDRIVGRAHNRREIDRNPLAHAELLAIHQASMHLDRWRLTGCTLYVTLEPCPMCAGALINARLDRLVFGALDEKIIPNHRISTTSGVLSSESAALLKQFFKEKRQK